MKTIAKLRKVLPALGLLGCVSDFSPDPYKSNPNDLSATDGGVADAGSTVRRDGGSTPSDSGGTPRQDAGSTEPPPAQGDDAGSTEPPPTGEPKGACDLSGRWIMTERNLSSAFGAKQVNLGWFYTELTQQGSAVTFSKSVLCGGKTEGLGFKVYMDDSQAWDAYREKTNYSGRKGTSTESGGGCAVTFAEGALVRGMDPALYKDKRVEMPTLEQQASGDGPGWQDWDGDGKPGVTMNVTGAAQGKIYTSFRSFNNDQGTIEANASTFILDHDWVQERAVLQYEPATAFLLASPAERAPDQGANIVELARLADDQATGDDAAKCEAIRELAATLTPNGNKVE